MTRLRSYALRHRRAIWLAVASLSAIWAVFSPAGALETLRNLAIFVVVFGLIVGIHEFCHLLAARALGVRVLAFGLGFGPRIVARRKFGIEWQLRALPLGGYVKLSGEESDEGPDSFAAASAKKRILILLAGPLSNLVLAFLLICGMAVAMGLSIERAPEAAFQIIAMIIDQTINSITAFLPVAGARPLDLPMVGIPGMIGAVGTMLAIGPYMLVILAAAMSLSLGLMNLLPIPPLDGGQAAMIGLKALLGRYFPTRAAVAFARVSFSAIVLLMLIINGLDLYRTIIGYLPH